MPNSLGMDNVLKNFALFHTGNEGIEGWLQQLPPTVEARIQDLANRKQLTHAQLNQLLTLSREAAMSPGFFRYYFGLPKTHPWDIRQISPFSQEWFADGLAVRDAFHLYWGMYRLFCDGLLYFGNVRTAYRELREKTYEELEGFFVAKRMPTSFMKRRGQPIPLNPITSTDRYLIAEQACKAFESSAETAERLAKHLWRQYQELDRVAALEKIKHFLEFTDNADLLFALDEIKEEDFPTTEAQLAGRIRPIFERWHQARQHALSNSQIYLSMVNELDVYVATSMRSRPDFTALADNCERIFKDPKLVDLNLRYFDPTQSAANCHEDKGLIECLMVKCAKVLLFFAGSRDSYGKDAEAAMALSQGKPVIFFCEEDQRRAFFNQIHPLSRLIEFSTGVAVGAMAVSERNDVVKLLGRLFRNEMVYKLEQKQNTPGFLTLKEEVSSSVVRLQSSDKLLSSTFWNYYHGGSRFQDEELELR